MWEAFIKGPGSWREKISLHQLGPVISCFFDVLNQLMTTSVFFLCCRFWFYVMILTIFSCVSNSMNWKFKTHRYTYRNLAKNGPVWSCLDPYGHLWPRMVLYGPVWYPMVPYCPVWSCKVLDGPIWSRMIPHGPAWSCMILNGIIW